MRKRHPDVGVARRCRIAIFRLEVRADGSHKVFRVGSTEISMHALPLLHAIKIALSNTSRIKTHVTRDYIGSNLGFLMPRSLLLGGSSSRQLRLESEETCLYTSRLMCAA
jgi:hypothetical protein